MFFKCQKQTGTICRHFSCKNRLKTVAEVCCKKRKTNTKTHTHWLKNTILYCHSWDYLYIFIYVCCVCIVLFHRFNSFFLFLRLSSKETTKTCLLNCQCKTLPHSITKCSKTEVLCYFADITLKMTTIQEQKAKKHRITRTPAMTKHFNDYNSQSNNYNKSSQ